MVGQNDRLRRMFLSDSRIMMETLHRVIGRRATGEWVGTRLTPEQIERAFRAAHSLKSEAGFLQLSDVTAGANALEDRLTELRHADGIVTTQVADALESGLKILDEGLTRFRADATSDHDSVVSSDPKPNPVENTAVDLVRSIGAAERGMIREARERGERLYRIVVTLHSVPEMRYARAFLVVNNLEVGCAVISISPRLEQLQDSTSAIMMLVSTAESESWLADRVNVDEVSVEEIAEVAYDEVLESGGSPIASDAMTATDEVVVPVPVGLQEEIGLLSDELVGSAQSIILDGGEVSAEMASRTVQLAKHLRARVAWGARIELLDVIRSAEPKMVHYAASQRKRVRVRITGSGAMVSSAVADLVLEALFHLVRNSIDHGLEPIEGRVARGRPPAGSIRIHIDRPGEQIRVAVKDDGTGVDEAALRRDFGDLQTPLLALLAKPGVSARRQQPGRTSIPDGNPGSGGVSGRGVGVGSVVHSVRSLLSGSVSMKSEPGRGVTFVMQFPDTGRLFHVTIVSSGRMHVALPTSLLTSSQPLEIRRVKRDSFGSTWYEQDGDTVPLRRADGGSVKLEQLSTGMHLLVARGASGPEGIVADRLLATEPVLRHDPASRTVYSRTLEAEVPLLLAGFPPRPEA